MQNRSGCNIAAFIIGTVPDAFFQTRVQRYVFFRTSANIFSFNRNKMCTFTAFCQQYFLFYPFASGYHCLQCTLQPSAAHTEFAGSQVLEFAYALG